MRPENFSDSEDVDVSFLDKTPSEILARYGTCVSEEDTPPFSGHIGIYLQLHTS
jgi:hypothetical protein